MPALQPSAAVSPAPPRPHPLLAVLLPGLRAALACVGPPGASGGGHCADVAAARRRYATPRADIRAGHPARGTRGSRGRLTGPADAGIDHSTPSSVAAGSARAARSPARRDRRVFSTFRNNSITPCTYMSRLREDHELSARRVKSAGRKSLCAFQSSPTVGPAFTWEPVRRFPSGAGESCL